MKGPVQAFSFTSLNITQTTGADNSRVSTIICIRPHTKCRSHMIKAASATAVHGHCLLLEHSDELQVWTLDYETARTFDTRNWDESLSDAKL